MSVEKLRREIKGSDGTSAELREEPAHDPAGDVELGDEELDAVAGGNDTFPATEEGSACCTMNPSCPPPPTLRPLCEETGTVDLAG